MLEESGYALRRLQTPSRRQQEVAMDEKYIFGIPEIDSQHEDISKLVDLLREVSSKKDHWHLINQALKRLYLTLVNHFDYEEAMMGMVGYPDLPQHKQTHKTILNLFEYLFDHPPTPGDIGQCGNLISNNVIAHVMEQDQKMLETIRPFLGLK